MTTLQGSLEAIGLENLIRLILRNHQHGLLTVGCGERRRTLHVTPSGIRLRGASARAESADERRERAQEDILDLFHWTPAAFEFREGDVPVDPSSPLFPPSHLALLLVEAGRRGEEMDMIRKAIGRTDAVPAWTQKWTARQSREEHAGDIRAIAGLIDGARTIDRICGASRLSHFRTMRVLYILHWAGYLAFQVPRRPALPAAPAPEPAEAKVIWKRTIGGAVVVVLTDPLMTRAILRVRGERPSVMTLLRVLNETKLNLLDGLDERIEASDLKNLVVAQGTAPKRGRPGDVRWNIDWDREKTHVLFVSDQADFHESHSILQVAAGEIIGEIHPPTPGTDGTDVFGRPIPSAPGAPAVVHAGPNVEIDGALIRSRIFGRVRRAESRVWVDPLFWVYGDLDFHTGNVRFAGDVVVTGNVMDGFEIDATRSITVFGSVFASTLRAGGDIVILEGANGHDRGRLIAGGSVTATYLNAVEVRAGRDVKVMNEIMSSDVCAGGQVKIPAGAIVGGTVVGRRGLEAGVVGSPMHIATRVIVGVDPSTEELSRELSRRVQDASDKMLKAYHMIRPFADRPEAVDALPEARREAVRDQLAELQRLTRERAADERRLAELYGAAVDERDLRVRLRKRVHPKVTLSIGRISTTYDNELAGPMTLTTGDTRRIIRAV